MNHENIEIPISDGNSTEVENEPETFVTVNQKAKEPRPDPTRFGDWENQGRCIDF